MPQLNGIFSHDASGGLRDSILLDRTLLRVCLVKWILIVVNLSKTTSILLTSGRTAYSVFKHRTTILRAVLAKDLDRERF